MRNNNFSKNNHITILKLSENEYFKLKNILNISNLKIVLISSISIYSFYIFINTFEKYLAYGSDLKLFTVKS